MPANLPPDPKPVAHDEALRRLREGNDRFTKNASTRPRDSHERRLELTKSQHPFAVVLMCSDSHVVPELIFDQGIGDLFVMRVAGNILDDAVLGSIEYAVGALGVQLVVVMGHEGCGAVRATIEENAASTPHLDELVRAISPAVERARGKSGDLLANAVRINAELVAEQLNRHRHVLGPKVTAGELEIIPSYYSLGSGNVDFLDEPLLFPEDESTQLPAVAHPTLHNAEALFDSTAESLEELVIHSLQHLGRQKKLDNEERRSIESRLRKAGKFAAATELLGHAVGVARIPASEVTVSRVVLARCPNDGFVTVDGDTVRFLWVVVGPDSATDPSNAELEPFGWMLVDDRFTATLMGANDAGVVDAYERYLEFVESPPPPTPEVPPELQRTGRVFGGLINDVKRRLPHYGADFKSGFHPKVIASVLFLFFACFAPAVAFGGLLSVLTQGQIGAVEMIVGTAICGTIYALTSGQPLTILGSTGPVIIFMGIVYELCARFDAPFFPTLAWIGMWTSLILIVMAVLDASSLIRYFTRFTDETFAALISLIFIVEALQDSFKGFTDPDTPYDTALLSLLLAVGTFYIAQQLSRFRRSPYLSARYRVFLSDFGPTIAIVAMTVVAIWLHPVDLEQLAVPSTFTTTSGRGWLVNPFDAPKWIWGASLAPAILVSILLFLDQNITARLVNDNQHKLKRGAGYHLDLFVLGILVGVCSLFGLPWMVAATVRSLNHVRSLATTDTHGGEERIVSVRENRLSGLLVHLMVGSSLLFLGLLGSVPMSVLFGLFLYMGVASMRNNQFFERLRLWVMDSNNYPPTHYLRQVPPGVVHKFTAVQAAALTVLWVVKASALGIVFPLFIGLLVPVRMLMSRFFSANDLAFLDAEEELAEEEERSLD